MVKHYTRHQKIGKIAYQCYNSRFSVSNPSKDKMVVRHIFNTLYKVHYKRTPNPSPLVDGKYSSLDSKLKRQPNFATLSLFLIYPVFEFKTDINRPEHTGVN